MKIKFNPFSGQLVPQAKLPDGSNGPATWGDITGDLANQVDINEAFATATQGGLADTALQPGDSISAVNVTIDVTELNGNLSSANTTLQSAIETLDELETAYSIGLASLTDIWLYGGF
jgi:hypothetical protein